MAGVAEVAVDVGAGAGVVGAGGALLAMAGGGAALSAAAAAAAGCLRGLGRRHVAVGDARLCLQDAKRGGRKLRGYRRMKADERCRNEAWP